MRRKHSCCTVLLLCRAIVGVFCLVSVIFSDRTAVKMSDSESQFTTVTKYRYAVVWFESEKVTELVPLSWVHNEEGQDFCYYPPKKDYKYMDAWLTSCADPEIHWESFIAEILSRTKSLEKGKQRLKRSYMTKDIESTDGEGSALKTPIILSEKSIKKTLKDVPPMFSSRQETSCNSTDSFATNRITRHHAKESNAVHGITEEYLDTKLHELMVSLNSSMKSMKRSLLYDIDIKTNEIKNALVANINQARAPMTNCSEARAGVGVALPIKNLNDFLIFDKALKEDEEKKKALMSLYRVLVCGESEAKDCISKIMLATMAKSVETHYSGTGRVIKNVGKKNFSATATYGCLKDTLVEKFGDNNEVKNLEGKVGRWLSGAGDRDGGRANRKKCCGSDVDNAGNAGNAATGNINIE